MTITKKKVAKPFLLVLIDAAIVWLFQARGSVERWHRGPVPVIADSPSAGAMAGARAFEASRGNVVDHPGAFARRGPAMCQADGDSGPEDDCA